MHQLIVTADDYGMSSAINKAIDCGIERGLITSTNVMTNMDYYQESRKLRNSNVSVGIHWVLSCGKPVESADRIPTLVNTDGCFYSYPVFRNRYRKGLISDDDIKKELVAQYNRFKELLGKPDYWNTHQNVHVDFRIYALFVRIAIELNILKMRSHQRIYVPSSNNKEKRSMKWRIMEPVKAKILDCWQHNANKRGISSPDGLIVCLNKSDATRPEVVFDRIIWKSHKIAEFVIHPAVENDSPYFGSIVDQRILEYQMFTDEKTALLLKPAGIQLTNYTAV